ncbi:hypothetical protein B0H19DRAFT_1080753 [Mycena capillaripes]|nr:hypothetical protein B0H19DRAFT_1080753 [Mycena capillaripes]
MHPSLRLGSLSTLPPSLRVSNPGPPVLRASHAGPSEKTALAAARGSEDDLHDLEYIMEDNLSNPKMLVFLPVFYANIDPAKVPSAKDLDGLPPIFTRQCMLRALVSVKGIYHLAHCLPPAVFPEIWPRLWPWFHFFETYRGQFYDYGITCLDFLIFVSQFKDSKEAARIMFSTAGFRFMLTAAWTLLIENDDTFLPIEFPSTTTNAGLDALTDLLFSPGKVVSPGHVKEVIDGAGGRLPDLAHLVSSYISSSGMWDDDDDHILNETDDIGRFGTGIFDFVNSIDRALSSNKLGGFELGPLTTALASGSVVTSLATVAEALTDDGQDHLAFPPLLGGCLTLLNRILMSDSDHVLMDDALNSMEDLLRTVVICGSAKKFQAPLTSLLEKILPQYLMHCYGVQCIGEAIDEAEDSIDTETFRTSSIYAAWCRFAALAAERLEIDHKTYDSERLKSCDNLDCGEFGESAKFRRCARCLSFYYCSTERQKLDWYTGDHRKYCRPDRSVRLSACQDLCVRDRYFLLEVLYHDFRAAKKSNIIQTQQAAFESRNRGGVQFFTLFDYTAGRVAIRVEAADHCASAYFGGDMDDQWHDHVARALRSDRQIALLVMAVPAGTKTRYFVIPHRGESLNS